MSKSSEALAALSAAMVAALEAVDQPVEALVEKMRAVDMCFGVAVQEAGDPAVQTMIRDVVEPQKWAPEVLAKIDFASSLVSMTRPFFTRVMYFVGENAQALNPQQLVSAIGACRRNRGYTSMRRFDEVLRFRLMGDDSPNAYGFRAKASYELHMAAYQQAEASQDAAAAQALYYRSLELARLSADEATRAGDVCGRLFVEMNETGLLLPKMGRWEEGFRKSERVSSEAEELAADAPDDEAKKRPLRVAMNCYLHRIDMLVQNGGDKGAVPALLEKLNSNPIYQACKDHADVKAAVECAQRYVSI